MIQSHIMAVERVNLPGQTLPEFSVQKPLDRPKETGEEGQVLKATHRKSRSNTDVFELSTAYREVFGGKTAVASAMLSFGTVIPAVISKADPLMVTTFIAME